MTFLEENFTQHPGFCKEQNRKCSRVDACFNLDGFAGETSRPPNGVRKNSESCCRRHFRDCGWQSEMKRRASSVVGCGPQTATMRFHD